MITEITIANAGLLRIFANIVGRYPGFVDEEPSRRRTLIGEVRPQPSRGVRRCLQPSICVCAFFGGGGGGGESAVIPAESRLP